MANALLDAPTDTPTPIVPRHLVDPPTPARPAPYSLLSAATVLEDVPAHQLTGIEYETVCSTRVEGYPAPCNPGTDTLPRTKAAAPTTVTTIATPFVLYAADPCVLGRDDTDARRQLKQRFTAGEPAAVEHLVETGAMGNWPNLAKNPVDVLTGGAVDLVDAVGMLEQWLADTTGGTGVIHATRTVAPRLFTQQQVAVSGGRAETRLGSTLVFGTGYTGAPPEGHEDSRQVWLYATPPVTVRRSTLIEPAGWTTGAFNRAENSGFLLLERVYVAEWPCGVAAIETSLGRPS